MVTWGVMPRVTFFMTTYLSRSVVEDWKIDAELLSFKQLCVNLGAENAETLERE